MQYLSNERQTPFTTFGIRFKDPKPGSSTTWPVRVKVFGKAAEECIAGAFNPGDTLVVTGACLIEKIDRQEGFKENRAVINAKTVQRLSAGAGPVDPPASPQTPAPAYQAPPAPSYQDPPAAPAPQYQAPPQPPAYQAPPAPPVYQAPPAPAPAPEFTTPLPIEWTPESEEIPF